MPDAQYKIGVLNEKYKGVPTLLKDAAEWYRLAAEQGYIDAQLRLAEVYEEGQGVPKDIYAAAKWYRRAAGQGNANAQLSLGVMSEDGQGVPQNYVMAYVWYSLAASQLSESEKEMQTLALNNMDIITPKMSQAQIAEAQKLAREWKPKAER